MPAHAGKPALGGDSFLNVKKVGSPGRAGGGNSRADWSVGGRLLLLAETAVVTGTLDGNLGRHAHIEQKAPNNGSAVGWSQRLGTKIACCVRCHCSPRVRAYQIKGAESSHQGCQLHNMYSPVPHD